MQNSIRRKTEIAAAISETASYIGMALKALYFWRKPPPIRTVAELVSFTESRAKYVTQTSLYGYIKTRAGTRYVSLMMDDVYAESVNIAKWEVYLASLQDFATYTSASVGRQAGWTADDMRALACHLVETAIEQEEALPERPQSLVQARQDYPARAATVDWTGDLSGETVLQSSLDALVEWAPIADELKVRDVQIVKTSMRHRWRKVRDQFEAVVDPGAITADWQASGR